AAGLRGVALLVPWARASRPAPPLRARRDAAVAVGVGSADGEAGSHPGARVPGARHPGRRERRRAGRSDLPVALLPAGVASGRPVDRPRHALTLLRRVFPAAWTPGMGRRERM